MQGAAVHGQVHGATERLGGDCGHPASRGRRIGRRIGCRVRRASAASVATSGASAAAQAVASTAEGVSPALGSMESFAYAIMLYFLATGLLGSYLLTRLFLQRALANAVRLDGP
jgi:hypothetical protein